MPRNEGVPGIFAAEVYSPLSAEAEVDADFEARWKSVWPFVLSKTRYWVNKLGPRQRAFMDLDDVLQEVYLEFRAKDAKWDHGKGKYITFVGTLLWRKLSDMKSSAQSEMRKYAQASDGSDECDNYAYAESREPNPMDEVEDSADGAMEVEALLKGIAKLSPFEAVVLGKHYGLWGSTPMTFVEIGDALQMPAGRCRRIADNGKAKLKAEITGRGIR